MIRNIIKDNEFLSKKSIDATEEDLFLAHDLLDTLKFNSSTCVGMALNMIGYNKNIIAINDNGNYILLINPVILKQYGNEYEVEEGCLCHIGTRKTKRYQKIQVSYLDEKFKNKIRTFTNFTAEIIQHEIDHLNGILI